MTQDASKETMPEETPAPEVPEAEPVTFPEAETDLIEAEIAGLREEAGKLKDQLLRTFADMDNLRKRMEREKAEATLYAASNFARDILSVSDNMDRALATAEADHLKEATEPVKNLVAGVEMTRRELLNVFERHGIKRVDPMGEKFDPHYHQAVFEVPTDDQPPGTVVQVMQAGFKIGERVLRPAMVGVAKAAG
ncbi:MAG: nucleotide exchange factor GrpE [Alphaproteobacteria bacterium]|jgi:molecular chaperone GrpE|nr:MAG: nucleotide exchange factor GrpE [Alphaproteobacteria bacterium]